MTLFETINQFAERTGLPIKLIRIMVRQGQLPHIKTGKAHVRIHIDSALDALRQKAEKTAEEIAATLPVPISLRPPKSQQEGQHCKKYKGRPPDSVRLGRPPR